MSDWNTQIIEEFRANGGKVGGPFEGAPMILVHHTGAKSGTERVTPLVYFPQPDDRIVIMASKAGAPTHPDWYHNLMAHPDTKVEVGTETIPVRVSEAESPEREEIWDRAVAAMPGFGEYQEKTSRRIPVLILTRAA